jgi:TusA-related sulfurtransferase
MLAAMVERAGQLDLRGVKCPLNWAKARVVLDEMRPGERLALLLDDPRAVRDIPVAAEACGFAAEEAEALDGYWRLVVEV